MRDFLPALISFGNMGCGFASMICVFGQRFEYAGWLIILATVLDAFDGKVARISNSTSKFGSQLDSLADLVTFGIAPAIMVGRICTEISPIIVWGVSFFFVICAAVRLARFSCESQTCTALFGTESASQPDGAHHQTFTGLPTTSAGGAIASLLILNAYLHTRFETDVVLIFLPASAFVLAILMICKVRYTHAKVFFTAKQHGTIPFLLEVVSATIFFVLCPQITVSAAFCFYTISGLLGLLKGKVFTRQPNPT
ncbi:MAG TPA: CDP-alcohol phosphatidyltransferase family protein [Candidatus Brocadiia bacterium]|nr:CDP-alcohol phosphatidyltransferase family protein [Planctomycetota bacterium]MDO8092520.1 CDP-alcohol phosphatidyltransferase family protein [Candidatus Brocadiales bacterium]